MKREPTLIVAVIGALLTWLVSFNLDFLNAGQASAAVALISAAVIAATTRPVAPALFTGVIAAGAALVAEYGLHFTDAQVGGLSALVLAVFAAFGVRPQVTPVKDPRFDAVV
jgi:hypothetical protein